jgi:EpsI family protein
VTDKGRRDAVVLLGVMGAVSAAAAIVNLVPYGKGAAAKIDLDQIFPKEFDDWRVDETASTFVRPSADQGKRYGIYDQVLERTFVNDQGERVMLSVAYGSDQSGGLELHRPELCYHYNGYQVLGFQLATLASAGRTVPVIDLQAEMPGRPEPVTYWIVIGGQPVTNPRTANWRRMSFSLRRQVPDGLLVRMSSINPNPTAAYALHRSFADCLLRAMSPEHRALVIGSERPSGS